MTPEILIVGDPAERRKLADLIASVGYGVASCAPHELNRRVRSGPTPAAIIACLDEIEADVLLAGLRRSRAGASIPVILYGRLGGQIRDLDDALDLGADHFLEEPARERELAEVFGQLGLELEAPARRPSPRGRERDYEGGRGGREPERDYGGRSGRSWRDEEREPARGRERERGRDPREREPEQDWEREPAWEDRREEPPSRPPVRRRPRGEALSELHRTLERLDASLRSDERSDPELSQLSELGGPEDAENELEGEPLVTEIGEHLRSRPRTSETSERTRPRRRERETEPERARPSSRWRERERESTQRIESSSPRRRDRERESEDGTDSERSRRRTRSREEDTGRTSERSRARPRGRDRERESGGETSEIRTRAWDRPINEGPLRRGRERSESSRADTAASESSRSSAVLRGRRPGRDRDPSEGTSRFEASSRVESSRGEGSRAQSSRSEGTARFENPARDPHDRSVPWPTDDFDPSESTMIRRERSSATARRRSTGNWRRNIDAPEGGREFGWGGRGSGASESSSARESGRSALRGRAPERAPERIEGDQLARELERSQETTSSGRPKRGRRETPEPEAAPARREPSEQTSSRARREPAVDAPPEPRAAPASTPTPAVSVSQAGRGRTRRVARSSAAPEQPRLRIDPSLSESGKLGDDVDVATVLWTLHEQRFTGKLRLNRGRIDKQVWLYDGEAVFAKSTATRDRLVDGLLRRGVLTRPQYETARRLAAKDPRRAGQLLVDAGFLKARELDAVIRDHLARVIDSTFDWLEGSWGTEPGERTDEPIQLEVPMAALVLDGVRYRCDASELEERLTQRAGGRGPLVPRLRVGEEHLGEERERALDVLVDTLAENFRLLPEEESWLRRLDGRHGVATLIAEGADEQALFALLFTLDLGGHIELREQPKPIVEGAREPAQIDSDRILARLRLAREADYFELLGVARDASGTEVRQAHGALVQTFADESLEDDSRARHARELRELRAAIEEARDILSDDAMRSAYLAHLTDGA